MTRTFCAKCQNKGWFEDGCRRYRCALCDRQPTGVALGPASSGASGLPEAGYPPRFRPDRGPIPTCHLPGCHVKTSGGKPYCVKHMFLLPYPKQVRDHVAEVTAEIRLAGLETPRPPARGVKAAEIALVLAQKGPLPPKMLALAVDIVTPGRAIGENQSGQIRLLAFVAAMKAAGLVRIVEVRPARGRATQARLWISLTQAGLAFAAEARQKELELDAKFPITLRPKQETTNDYDPSPIRRIRIRGLSVIRTVGRS